MRSTRTNLSSGILTILIVCFSLMICAAGKSPRISDEEKSFEEIRRLSLMGGHADTERAAKLLRELARKNLSAEDRDTYIRLSRDTALRLGDRKWLEELSKQESPFSSDLVYTVLLAYGKLTKADVAGAEKLLDGIRIEEINPREQRRVYALRARIAQMKHDTATERRYLEKMIAHLPSWPDANCQSCHNNFQQKDKVPSLPIKELWFGERYVELMRQTGTAEAVLARATAELAMDKKNDLARIQLGYALMAQGKSDQADNVFQELSYYPAKDRSLPKPRMVSAFP